MALIYLADITHSAGTLRYSSKSKVVVSGNTYLPYIKQPAFFSQSISFDNSFGGAITTSVGELIILNYERTLDSLKDLIIEGYTLTLSTYDTVSLAQTTVLVKKIEQLVFEWDQISVRLTDEGAKFDKPLQTSLYLGTNTLPNGVEGVLDLKDKPKPLLYGRVSNFTPVLVNTSKYIYQISSGTVEQVVSVMSNGSYITPSSNTIASLADLTSDAVGKIPLAGTFTFYSGAEGSFIRVAMESGTLTCTAWEKISPINCSIASIVKRVMASAGYSTSVFYGYTTNLLTYSEQFGNTAWVKTNMLMVINSAVAPDGTRTAAKLIPSTATGNHYIYNTYTLTAPSVTFSVYVKAAEFTTLRLSSSEASTPANPIIADFNLVTVTATPVNLSTVSASIIPVGNGWFRISATTNTAALVYTSWSIVPNIDTSYTGDGISGIYVWGAQLEQSTSASPYIQSTDTFTGRTTTATYVGSDGLIKTAAAGEARYNYNPTNLTIAPKLLLEEQRTNLFTYSEDFSNASWVKTSASITSNAISSPDGTSTSSLVVSSSTAATPTGLAKSVSVTSGTSYTLSIFVKNRSANSPQQYITLFFYSSGFSSYKGAIFNPTTGVFTFVSSGLLVNTCAMPNGWFRISATAVAGATISSTVEFRFGSSSTDIYQNTSDNLTDGLYIWGAQLEAAVGETSYIPTTTATVTRNADTSTSTTTTGSAELIALDTKQADSLGYYVNGTDSISSVLDALCSSVGCYWGFDGNNKFRIVQFGDFTQTSLGTFSSTSATSRLGITSWEVQNPTYFSNAAPLKEVKLQYDKNWTVIDKSSQAGIVVVEQPQRSEWLSNEWRETSRSTTSNYPLAQTVSYQAYLISEFAAKAEALRILDLFSVKRDEVQLVLSTTADILPTLLPGKMLSITLPRFGLTSGKNFLITSVEVNYEDLTANLTIWG